MRAALLLLVLFAWIRAASAQPPAAGNLELGASDRILILAPHPDDEVLGCGGIIQRSVALKLPIKVVYFTYGDNNEWSFLVYRKHAVVLPSAVKQMGLIRHDEALAAAQSLGLQTSQLVFLGYPDFGTLKIWTSHWGDSPPYASMMTRTTQVPYPNAFRPGAAYLGQEIVRDLTSILREFKPTRIFVSHPADFNVDHRALYCFTRLTLWNLEREMRPEVFPYLIHFPDWPRPRGHHPEHPLLPPVYFDDDIAWQTLDLSPEVVAGNEKAIRLHRSQFEYAGHYLSSFLRTNELFGDFAPLIFTASGLHSPRLLHATSPAVDTPAHYPENEDNQLTEAERNGFVGLEWRHVQIESNTVTVSITLSRPLAEAVSASIHVFGYRRDTPFESMPKIRVEIGALLHSAHDRQTPLPHNSIRVSRHLRELEAKIPLDLLGRPERLFISARTYLGDIPLDWVSWRLVELR
ncbi:MAG: PIG-L family deacetylase [bacterium]